MKLISTLSTASRAALQWRLLLLWLGALLLPTLLLSLPFWSTLSGSLDNAINTAALAQQLDMLSITDLLTEIRRNFLSLQSAALAALILTLLLSPFLTGAIVTAARAPQPSRFGQLFAGGVAEYPRMFRMLLWAIVPLGIAAAIGGQLMDMAGEHADKAVLATDGDHVTLAATIATVLLIAIANATLDAGRAELAIDRRRSSAVKAWWRGVKLLLRRPGSALGGYFVLTVVGLLAAALLATARLNIPAASLPGFVGALLVTQLIALVTAWMRSARLFALVSVSAANKG